MGAFLGNTGIKGAIHQYNPLVLGITLNTYAKYNSNSEPLQDNPVSENRDEEKEEKQEKEEKESESNEIIVQHLSTLIIESNTTKAFFHYKNTQPTYIILDKPIKPPRYTA